MRTRLGFTLERTDLRPERLSLGLERGVLLEQVGLCLLLSLLRLRAVGTGLLCALASHLERIAVLAMLATMLSYGNFAIQATGSFRSCRSRSELGVEHDHAA